MILTKETVSEQDNFFDLFNNYVDEVTVTPYTERGSDFDTLTQSEAELYEKKLEKNQLPYGVPYLRNSSGEIQVSAGRLPCSQPFQRLMITYDGRVAMCCYDWGAMYPVGYVSSESFEDGNKNYQEVLDKISLGKKGYKNFKITELPPVFNNTQQTVKKIREIWNGPDISKVRNCHIDGRIDDINICEKCPFQDTYDWR